MNLVVTKINRTKKQTPNIRIWQNIILSARQSNIWTEIKGMWSKKKTKNGAVKLQRKLRSEWL